MVPVGATNVGSIKINFDQARNIPPFFSRNYQLIHLSLHLGSANKRARTSAPAGDIHGGGILGRVAGIAWPAVTTGPGDGRVLSWEHDRAGVRSAAFVRVWCACRAESARGAAAGEFTKGEGRMSVVTLVHQEDWEAFSSGVSLVAHHQSLLIGTP
jgi:phosphatidylserine decarboxylase